MVIANDKRGFKFITDLLIVGYEIMIEVISNEPVNIIAMRLLP